jgi:hypothetical protein
MANKKGLAMTVQTQTITRHDLEAGIIRRSLVDGTFREQLLADPAGVFAGYLRVPGASLPKITVHQEDPGSWHIVLPAKPLSAAELSDADLVKVAGGGSPFASAIFLGTVAVSAAASAVTVSIPVTIAEGGW